MSGMGRYAELFYRFKVYKLLMRMLVLSWKSALQFFSFSFLFKQSHLFLTNSGAGRYTDPRTYKC
jgi:hypothetical protein